VIEVHVHREDHGEVARYYLLRGAQVKLVHDPDVRWPSFADPQLVPHNRYEELE